MSCKDLLCFHQTLRGPIVRRPGQPSSSPADAIPAAGRDLPRQGRFGDVSSFGQSVGRWRGQRKGARAPPRHRQWAELIASPGVLLTGTVCRQMMERFSPVKNNSLAAVVHPGSAVRVVSIYQRVSYPNDVIAVKS